MTDKTIDMTDDENVLELYHRLSKNEQELNDILTIDAGETKIEDLNLQLVEKLEWKPSEEGNFIFDINGNEHNVEIKDTIMFNKLKAHYKSNSLSHLNKNDKIEEWHDESSNSHTAIQSNESKRPTYDIDEDDDPFVKFNGDKGLYIENTSLFPETDDWTVFIVIKSSQDKFGPVLAQYERDNSKRMGFHPRETNGKNIDWQWGDEGKQSENQGPNGEKAVITVQRDNNTAKAAKSKNEFVSAITEELNIMQKDTHIGTSSDGHYYDGRIYEILIYDGVIKDENRLDIVKHLEQKWL